MNNLDKKTLDMMTADATEFLSQEIVRELLLEVEPSTDDALVEKIWAMCGGNPWNAALLYLALEIKSVSGK